MSASTFPQASTAASMRDAYFARKEPCPVAVIVRHATR